MNDFNSTWDERFQLTSLFPSSILYLMVPFNPRSPSEAVLLATEMLSEVGPSLIIFLSTAWIRRSVWQCGWRQGERGGERGRGRVEGGRRRGKEGGRRKGLRKETLYNKWLPLKKLTKQLDNYNLFLLFLNLGDSSFSSRMLTIT